MELQDEIEEFKTVTVGIEYKLCTFFISESVISGIHI